MTSWYKNMLYVTVRTQQLELSLQKVLGSNPVGAKAFSLVPCLRGFCHVGELVSPNWL